MTMEWSAVDRDAGLFALEKVATSGWCWRALALRLDADELLVVSPIRGTSERASLDAIGKPRFVLAPNHFHYFGIAELRERDASLECVATRTASARLARKCGHAFAPLEALRERLPAGVELLEPLGLKNGEAWLRVSSSSGVTWAVCDAFFNVSRPVTGAMGLALRATATVPGLRIGNTWRWLATGDRRAYRRWLEERIEADRPRRLIMGHGDIVEDDGLSDRLLELARARLS